MPKPMRVTPWLRISITQGNVVQIAGLLGAVALAWHAGREGTHGTRPMVASRLLAYFCEHAFSHWLVGRVLGIRFSGYGLHGTSHPQHYPPVARFFFSHLPLLSARADHASLGAARSVARASMYAAGTVATVVASLGIPGYCWWRGVRGAAASSSGRTCGACRCCSANRCAPAGTCAARGGSSRSRGAC
jgi:hypothetical protein